MKTTILGLLLLFAGAQTFAQNSAAEQEVIKLSKAQMAVDVRQK